jgi:hypothetical protein
LGPEREGTERIGTYEGGGDRGTERIGTFEGGGDRKTERIGTRQRCTSLSDDEPQSQMFRHSTVDVSA